LKPGNGPAVSATEFSTVTSGVRRKFSRGGKFRHSRVTSQSCDVTNQLWGKCRRHDHSRGSGSMPTGKFCKITPKNTHFCALWKEVLDNTAFTFFYF